MTDCLGKKRGGNQSDSQPWATQMENKNLNRSFVFIHFVLCQLDCQHFVLCHVDYQPFILCQLDCLPLVLCQLVLQHFVLYHLDFLHFVLCQLDCIHGQALCIVSLRLLALCIVFVLCRLDCMHGPHLVSYQLD